MNTQLTQSSITVEPMSETNDVRASFSIKLEKVPRDFYSFLLKEMNACHICINAEVAQAASKECCGTWRFLEEKDTRTSHEVNATWFCQVHSSRAFESAKSQLADFYEYYYKGLRQF
jgi:hypothetical protein